MVSLVATNWSGCGCARDELGKTVCTYQTKVRTMVWELVGACPDSQRRRKCPPSLEDPCPEGPSVIWRIDHSELRPESRRSLRYLQ
eukprot:5703002-Amphidinium_carterae.1